MYAFGGRSLVETVQASRKSGRGAHRKNDEQIGNYKMIGLLIRLIGKHSSGGRYGDEISPNIAAIYRDICNLESVKNNQEMIKGVGKSTFQEKETVI